MNPKSEISCDGQISPGQGGIYTSLSVKNISVLQHDRKELFYNLKFFLDLPFSALSLLCLRFP
jgi:hypothetical protein